MTFSETMAAIRQRMGYWWLVILFLAIYVPFQITIASILEGVVHPVEVIWLQITSFDAATYKDTFTRWEQMGLMHSYRAHLIMDDIHWLWYTLLLVSMMSLAMKKANAPAKSNYLLMLPIIAGPCDALENYIQHVFLSSPGFVTIVDPLPLIGTLASITKWVFALAAILVIFSYIFKSKINKK